MPTTEELRNLLLADLSGAEVSVRDITGGGDHFAVKVTSERFRGLSRVAQHRLIYESLGLMISDGRIHAVSIMTRVSGEGESDPRVSRGGESDPRVSGEGESGPRVSGEGESDPRVSEKGGPGAGVAEEAGREE